MPRPPMRKTFEILGYTYEAATHCPACAEKRFGPATHDDVHPPRDREGHKVRPMFLDEGAGWGYHCDTCDEPLDD